MPLVKVGNRQFDVDVIAFDKDGTLIDFHIMWGQRAVAAVNAVLERLGYDNQLENTLYQSLGYDRNSGTTESGGPLATVPLAKTDIIMSTVLYQHGLPWHEAEQVILDTFSPVMSSAPTEESVRPLGNVREAIESFNANGIRTVVVTTDNRIPTMQVLRMLSVEDCFDVSYCGDDHELPQKPSAQVLHHVAETCSVGTNRIMMVGDTVADLTMAHGANAGAKIGVVGGATERDVLSKWSDAVISSIDEIIV